MKALDVYLVGGAVRDQLLGIKVTDRDYLVVGATPSDLKKLGFISVGKDFPVFLHPDTKEEYALARKEIKTGAGYKGFDFDYSKNITLEEDLYRRDFKINAMALKDDTLYDPYNGQEDLKNKILTHVSEHFIEDPLRLIRGARFKSVLGFEFAFETKKLLKEISASGELEILSKDRIFMEFKKVLKRGEIVTKDFLKTLDDLHALKYVFAGFDVEKLKISSHELNESEVFSKFLICCLDPDQYFIDFNVPNEYKKSFKALRSLNDVNLNDHDSVNQFLKLIRYDEKRLNSVLLSSSKEDFFILRDILEKINSLSFKGLDLSEINNQRLSVIRDFLS